jgi:hypothetical protein
MRKSVLILFVFLLAFPALGAGQTPKPKTAAKKSSTTAAKSTTPPAKPAEPAVKRTYSDLSIGELVSEDPNRWTEKMATHAAVSGFVTEVTKKDDGDVDIRICENPKIDGMDRARCVMAQCIPKIPCDLPLVGKPITVKGITRYDAKVGSHWWEINPVEMVEK